MLYFTQKDEYLYGQRDLDQRQSLGREGLFPGFQIHVVHPDIFQNFLGLMTLFPTQFYIFFEWECL